MAPLKGEALSRYVAGMIDETRLWLDSLEGRDEFDLVDAIGKLTFFNAVRALLGAETRDRFGGNLRKLYDDLTGSASDHLLRRLRARVLSRRRTRAKRTLFGALKDVIERRRKAPGVHDDYLQALLDAETGNDEPFTESDIIGLVWGLVWAGHATLWGQLAWAIIQLLQHPDYLDSVRDEHQAVIGSEEAITLAHLARLGSVNK